MNNYQYFFQMLSEYEILEELNAITDDMAFDSEDGGDSDADDYTL